MTSHDAPELSMDEILKSIRNIITEDRVKQSAEPQPIFRHGSDTNPSGARPLDPIPSFSKDDPFEFQNLAPEHDRWSTLHGAERPYSHQSPMMEEDGYKTSQDHVSSLKDLRAELPNPPRYFEEIPNSADPLTAVSERESVAQKVRSYWETPAPAPAPEHLHVRHKEPHHHPSYAEELIQEKHHTSYAQHEAETKEENYQLLDLLRLLIDQMVAKRMDDWIETRFSGLLETALTRELKKIIYHLQG
jgi:hypothetical protein